MIKNLSDIRRLRRVGKIHLGVKETSARSGNPYPKAVDFFVVKPDESTPAPSAEAFKKVYGETPRELEVMFPVNQVNVFWDCFYKSYVRTATTGGKLICKGDGVSANRLNMETGEFLEIPCPGPDDCEYALDKNGKPTACRRVGTLQFLLPKVGVLGVWQIDTGSFNGIVSLNSDIDMIRTVTGGRIAMIPLILRVVPKKALVEGKQSIIHHLTVEYRGTMNQLVAYAARTAAPGYQLAAPNPNEIPADLMPPETLPLIEQGKSAPEMPQEPAQPAPAQEAAPAPKAPPAAAQAAQPVHKEPAGNIDAEIAAEFERLKYPQVKRDTLTRAFAKDKGKLLKTLKGAK